MADTKAAGKILVIVESPTKGRTIQKYLGDDYIVKACFGHTRDLLSGGRYGIGVDVSHDFRPYYGISPDKVAVVEELIAEAENASEILLLGDPDREGCAISWHLNELLKSSGKRISSVQTGEISKKALKAAIANPQPIDQNMFKAQEARRILDRIVGFMASPFLMEKFSSPQSAGRVQSVATRLIVEREAEISAFIPEEYWLLTARLMADNQPFVVRYKGRVSNKDQADRITAECGRSKAFVVQSITSKNKKISPPSPHITISLQKHMSQRHGWAPDRTMEAAQSLYETGYVTYIRTDSPRSSAEAMTDMRAWLRANKFEVPKRANEYKGNSAAQDAHECIRPTDVDATPKQIAASLTKDESELYRAIWVQYAASQMNPAEWATVGVVTSPENSPTIRFTTNGKTLVYRGYLELTGEIPDDATLPTLTSQQRVFPDDQGVTAVQRYTTPEPRFSVVTLLKELERREVGRPSSYAEIFKKITSRNYIELQGSSYVPTELGRSIIGSLVSKFAFVEPKYSAEMERQLDQIAAGTLNQTEMLRGFFAPFQRQLNAAYQELGHSLCDKCGAHMVEKTNKLNGSKFTACSAFPHCRNVISAPVASQT